MNSQTAVAYQKIKDMIFHLELLPGTRIPEMQISARLNISRTPVHDALLWLESERLVTITPNKGAAVSQFDEKQIRDIGAIRLTQDILAAQLASYYGSASDFDELEQMAELCEEAAAKGDVYHRIQTDMDFHIAITQLSRNSVLMDLQHAIYQQVHLIQVSQYTDIQQSLIQIHHHRPIIAAIRSGDMAQMRRLICQHVKDFYHLDPYVLRCCGLDSE